MDDIGYMSDLILPPHHFLEDWGINTPNPAPGHEIVAFQQPVVRPFFENRGEYLGTKSFPNILLSISKDPNLNLNTNFEGEDYLSIIKSDLLSKSISILLSRFLISNFNISII